MLDFMGLSSFRYAPVGILPFGVPEEFDSDTVGLQIGASRQPTSPGARLPVVIGAAGRRASRSTLCAPLLFPDALDRCCC